MKAYKWILHGCQKCEGDLALINGLDGWMWECVQCSKTYEAERVDGKIHVKYEHEILSKG